MTGPLTAAVRVARGGFTLDAALEARPAEPVALLGPNGAGKSTLLAALAGLLPIGIVAELVNVGALFAFAVVSVAVLVLRRIDPDREWPFRTPLVPVVPLLALAGCIVLAATLDGLTWVRFAVWLVVGIAVYLGYGRRHSLVGGAPPTAPVLEVTPAGQSR